MKTHKMQRSQWHHCSHFYCDSKFKSKSDLNHHTEGHDALESGKNFHVSSTIILVKHLRDWQVISKYIRGIDATMQGVMQFTIIG